MTQRHSNCPTCGRQIGACVHTTEGQVSFDRLPRLAAHDVADEYSARAGTIGQAPTAVDSHVSARPQPAIAAGGTGSNRALFDPKCRELAEHFDSGEPRPLTPLELDELAHDIQLCVEGYISLLDSEGRS